MDKPSPPPAKKPALTRRDDRLRREAEALRANLRRRKEQARARDPVEAPKKD